jgi:hypothetical protein
MRGIVLSGLELNQRPRRPIGDGVRAAKVASSTGYLRGRNPMIQQRFLANLQPAWVHWPHLKYFSQFAVNGD